IRGPGRSAQRKLIPFEERQHASLVRGLMIAADHLGSAGHRPPAIPPLRDYSVLGSREQQPNELPDTARVTKHAAGLHGHRLASRPFQKRTGAISESAILHAPTGSGKTEAALLWAQKNQVANGRLFYVLPYTASINAMYQRLGPGV